MYIGTSLILIAVGAILKFAVTADVSGVSIDTVGLILMLVGFAGLLLSLLFTAFARDRGVVAGDAVAPGDAVEVRERRRYLA
jgi:hypothetical protein